MMQQTDAPVFCEYHSQFPATVKRLASYALSLPESNSAANLTFVCYECLKPQIDMMLDTDCGSVDVQALR